jgi:hypothetical protein
MSVPSRLAAFLVGLALVFGLAFVVGRSVGPEIEADAHDMSGHDEESAYALRLGHRNVPAGNDRAITFRVLDARGHAVTAYDERHERDLHLVLVAMQDLRDYQHVHPTLGDDGTWSVDVDLVLGRYRVYADAQPSGAEPMILEAGLRATGGRPVSRPLPPPTDRVSVAGYDVGLVVAEGTATFEVTRGGEPVTDLEPYLGAYGHLVVIRRAGMGYLHAHPEDGAAGPEVAFEVEFGKPGRHALYFEFQHEGRVRTAMFTVDASGPTRLEH